ncbi:hypothetical protein ACFVQ3_12275 [Oerskovia sp. NPDC057915]|uniref:hypothetical protein n=1 Tax=Oerskovia sp. NPDC057915 TaxID=3346280 RepID=UPI0036D9ADA6
MEIDEEPPPVWFGHEVRVLAPSGADVGVGVVRGVVRPWRGRPWSFTVALDDTGDLVGVTAARVVPTGWFREDDGTRLTADEHARGRVGGVRPGDRMRHRHVTLRSHVQARDADEAVARTRELVAALGLDTVDVDEPVEHGKVPGTWVVVTGLSWPAGAGDDAEVVIARLTEATGLDWGAVSGGPDGCDAVWDPGDAVGPPTAHVTWMILDAVP